MSTLDFRPGDVVDIDLTGVTVVEAIGGPAGGCLVVEHGAGKLVIYPGDGAAITRAEPDNWPPQPGDVWGVHDDTGLTRWFASTCAGDPQITVVSEHGNRRTLDHFLESSPELLWPKRDQEVAA